MTDRRVSDEPSADGGVPDEPPPDNFEWTAEPEDPDAAGMPGEFVNDTGEGVQGVRSGESPPSDFDQESNN